MKERSMNLKQVPVSMRRVLFAFLFFSAWATPNLDAASTNGEEISVNEQSLQDKGIAISGVVADEKGEPLIGVSIQVEGTTVGTATDFDGKFSLTVPNNNSVLVFSYMGYTPVKKTVGASKVVDVVMKEDSKVLGEVVVTALGMKREQKSLGYAVTELKGDDLNKNAVNPISSLQGKVAGVDISGSDGGLFGGTKIQIRGVSTLKGNNQPIYVVDGVILDNGTSNSGDADWSSDSGDYGNALKNLNPDDFATVSVLKGAPATALYGSRGLNGAVVITTKGGGAQKGFGVSFSQTLGIDVVTKTPKQQHEYGVGNYSGNVGYGETKSDGSYYLWDNAGQFALNNGVHSLYSNPTGRYWGPKYDGSSIQLYDQTMGSYSAYKNNYKDAFRTGFNTNTNVTVRGGNETTSFYTSASYKYAEGTQDRNSFSRMSYLLKGSHKVSDRVTVSGNVSFAQSKPKNPVINMGEQYATVLGPSYNTKYYKKKYQGTSHTGLASTDYGDTYGKVPGTDMWWKVYENSNEQKETMIRPSVDVSVKIQDWVSFKAEANMNFYELRREIKNLGTGYNNAGTKDETGGKYEQYMEDDNQQTYAGTFTFNKPLNDFNVGGFVRGEIYNRNQHYTQAKTDGGLILPGQYFISNSKNQAIADAKKSYDKQMVSAIFAANLSWRDQVFMDITGRNDWSSSLVDKEGIGNYSYFYPSVTGSWLITQTFRDQLPEWISFAKVRASWAQVGNDMTPYLINMGYRLGSLPQDGGYYIYTNYMDDSTSGDDPNGSRILVSKDLKPERKNAWEFGLNWKFLDNRIGIDFTYYKENTKDQIMDVNIAPITGYKQLKLNAGNIQNAGVEIALNTVPFRNKDWEWTLDFTYTKNKSKIVSLDSRVQDYILLDGNPAYGNYRIGSVAKVGGEYGMLMTDSKPKRDENGNILLSWDQQFRVAKQIRSGEIEEIGSLMPKFLGSVSTGVSYKDFSLNVSLDMRYGGYIASYSNRYGNTYGISETSLAYRDASHGGISWVSQFSDSKGSSFSDGYIPDGVFQSGTVVTTPSGTQQDVSGMTYKAAYEAGYVEPVHASTWTYWNNSWGSGVVNDDWVHEVKYIALREISLSYRVPKSFSSKIGAKGMNLVATGRNLGYLYNSLPNDINPESVRGNGSYNFRERSYSPYTASFMFTVGLDF